MAKIVKLTLRWSTRRIVVTDLQSHSRLAWFSACADSYVVFNTRPHTILGNNSIYVNRAAIGLQVAQW